MSARGKFEQPSHYTAREAASTGKGELSGGLPPVDRARKARRTAGRIDGVPPRGETRDGTDSSGAAGYCPTDCLMRFAKSTMASLLPLISSWWRSSISLSIAVLDFM